MDESHKIKNGNFKTCILSDCVYIFSLKVFYIEFANMHIYINMFSDKA